MQKRTSGKNLPEVSCLTCWNDSTFEIADIEKIADAGFNVLFTCPYCLTSFTRQYYGFPFEVQLRDNLKKIIRNQNFEKPTSFKEWSFITGKVYRDSHPHGLYEEVTI